MKEIHEVLVVGAGTMGHGFAQIFAMNHLSVWLVDENEDLLKRARGWIMDNLNYMVELGEIGKREDPADLIPYSILHRFEASRFESRLCARSGQ